MTWLNGTLATCGFELKRSLTLQRMAVATVLALFPPSMLFISLAISPNGGVADFLTFFVILQVSLVTVLSLLLWATPIVFTEIEGKSWTFLASRPHGRISVYLGKYLAAVVFTSFVALTAISLSIVIGSVFGLETPIQTWACLCTVFVLAAFGYGAIFSLIGTVIFKRSMVLAAGYMLVWEGIISSFPAIVNRLTLRYHLQSIAIDWIGLFVPPQMVRERDYVAFYGEPVLWIHLAILIAFTAILLTAGCFVIVNRQYITSDENQ